jgi:DNA-binding response OmpR family regulator
MAQILLVEDNLLLLEMLSDILEDNGHKVFSAPDGEIALRMFYDKKYDVIICDLIMPNMDGMKFITEIRKTHPDVKIIAISGGDEHLPASMYLRATKDIGADRAFEKPINNKKLLSTIDELLNSESVS